MQYQSEKKLFFCQKFVYFKKKSYLCSQICDKTRQNMVKKLLSIAFISLLASVTYAQEAVGAHPWKAAEGPVATDISHWSLVLEGGMNMMDGDFNDEMKSAFYAPTVGLSLIYDFVPSWGLGIDYQYAMFHVSGKQVPDLLKAQQHRADLFVAYDLVNSWFPRAKKKIFSLQAIVGAGLCLYTRDLYYTNDGRRDPLTYGSLSDNGKMTFSTYLRFGANFEFNLSRSIALGLKGTYSLFLSDDKVDGHEAGNSNDGVTDVTLALRYKINANKKTHVRNLVNENAFLAEAMPAKIVERAPQKDTVVIYQVVKYEGSTDTVVMKSSQTDDLASAAPTEDNYYYIYFDSGKSDITDQGLTEIQKVASRMERDTALYALVIGYCDNTGSDQYNKQLAQKRARLVSSELLNEYDVAANHVATIGRGILVGKRSTSAYGPNRRVEIRVVNKLWYERLINQYREGLLESAVKPTAKAPKRDSDKVLDVVTMSSDKTLSNLARKYYQNTFCWVYIYQANLDKISNPNSITADTQLVIPVLTDEQKAISEAACKELYQSLK